MLGDFKIYHSQSEQLKVNDADEPQLENSDTQHL